MKEKKVSIILGIILIILVLFVILFGIKIINSKKFVKPSFDKTAVKISSEDEEKYSEKKIDIADAYSLYLDGNITLSNKYLNVEFASLSSNKVFLKIRVMIEDEIIGESGLLKPGEKIQKVLLTKNVSKGDYVTIHVMSYEKDTYFSAGSANFNVRVS